MEAFCNNNVGCREGDIVAYLTPFVMLGAVAFVSIASQCTVVPLDPESTSLYLNQVFLQLKPEVLFVIFDNVRADVVLHVVARAKTAHLICCGK